jgi:hypothetical protein
MTAKKKDHWSSLASLFGIGSSEPEAEQIVETTVVEPISTPEAVIEPTATPVVEAVALAASEPEGVSTANTSPTLPPATKPKKKRDHWGSLLGQLGLASNEPEIEEEPEPIAPPPPPPPKVVTRPAKPVPPPRPVVNKPTPPAPVATTPVSAIEEDAPEGPPGYQGPDLFERLQAERESERKRSQNKEPFEKLLRNANTPRRPHDDAEFPDDPELHSGIREIWAEHEQTRSTGYIAVPEEDPDIEIQDNTPNAEEDSPQPKRRRRRGRRRGRNRDDVTGREPVGETREKKTTLPPDDEDSDDFTEEKDELHNDDVDVDSRSHRSEESDKNRPKRKRRRRRRAEKPTAKTAAPVDVDFDDEDDAFDEHASSLDYMTEQEKGEHKHIPTWDDAIGSIVAVNMESRGTKSSAPSRGREVKESHRESGSRDNRGRDSGNRGRR